MSREEMAETLLDVTRAQQEEVELLGDVSLIIEAMKSLSHTRNANIQQLAQAHLDEIQQLRREHTYDMARMRIEKDDEIEVMREDVVRWQEQSHEQARQHLEKVRQLKHMHAYRMDVLRAEKDRELAAVRTELTAKIEERSSEKRISSTGILLAHKDRSIATLPPHFNPASRQLDRAGGDSVSVSNLSKQNLALRESNIDLQSALDKMLEELRVQQENASALVDGDAAASILNKEIRDAKYTEPSPSDLLWDSTMDAHQQIKILKNICTNRRAALKIRYDNLRHKKIKLERPLRRAQIDAAAEKYQRLVVQDMDNLLHWLDEITQDLVRKDLGLMERMDDVYFEHETRRNVRLERLSALADLCGVKGRISSENASMDDTDDDE